MHGTALLLEILKGSLLLLASIIVISLAALWAASSIKELRKYRRN